MTVDPEGDTLAVLAEFAKKIGADPSRWKFLTGSPKAVPPGIAVTGSRDGTARAAAGTRRGPGATARGPGRAGSAAPLGDEPVRTTPGTLLADEPGRAGPAESTPAAVRAASAASVSGSAPSRRRNVLSARNV